MKSEVRAGDVCISLKACALTTMMAILPPTSPTTVIGGFSLAIITGKHKWKKQIKTSLQFRIYMQTEERRTPNKNLQTPCKRAQPQEAAGEHTEHQPSASRSLQVVRVTCQNISCCKVTGGLRRGNYHTCRGALMLGRTHRWRASPQKPKPSTAGGSEYLNFTTKLCSSAE